MKTFWFTGLPCSGKTTLADALAKYLRDLNTTCVRLDGDHVRDGLSVALGYTPEGRHENIRRCSEVSKLLNDQGIYVAASFITPLHANQKLVREIVKNLVLVHVEASSEVCEQRDVKGMWARAREGKIRGFTGHDADYNKPINPELILDTDALTIQQCLKELTKFI